MLHFTANVFGSQLAARAASVVYAYPLIRRAVFLSEERHRLLLPRYILLVAFNAVLSYAGVEVLIHALPVTVLPANVLIEAVLFAINFLMQRDWIFIRHEEKRFPLPGNESGHAKRP